MGIFDIGGLGFWLFGFDWWNEIRVFFLMINLVSFDLMNVV